MKKILFAILIVFLSFSICKADDILLLKEIKLGNTGGTVEFYCIAGNVWKSEYISIDSTLKKLVQMIHKTVPDGMIKGVFEGPITCEEFTKSMGERGK